MGAEEDEEVSPGVLYPAQHMLLSGQGQWGGGALRSGGVGRRKGASACVNVHTCRLLEALRAGSAVHLRFLHTQSCLCRALGLQKTDRKIGIQIKGALPRLMPR